MENIKMINFDCNKNVKFDFISSRTLKSGEPYQRPINEKRIKELMDNFIIHAFEPLHVSSRNDTYYVFDGQHRLEVVLRINKGKDCLIPCMVHYGLEYEDEAKLLTEFDEYKRKISCNDKYKAKYEAKDPFTINLKEIIDSTGLQLSFDNKKSNNVIVATSKISSIYKKTNNNDDFKRYLNLLKNTWNGEETSLNNKNLGAVFCFFKTFKREMDDNRFVRSLQKVKLSDIISEGNQNKSVIGDLKYAKVLLNYYNKGLGQEKRLDEYRLKNE